MCARIMYYIILYMCAYLTFYSIKIIKWQSRFSVLLQNIIVIDHNLLQACKYKMT